MSDDEQRGFRMAMRYCADQLMSDFEHDPRGFNRDAIFNDVSFWYSVADGIERIPADA